MNSELKVTIIQTELQWKDIKRNLSSFDIKISSITEKTDLIVLPEMFSTGFTMDVDSIEKGDENNIIEIMKNWASSKNAAICGSIIVKEEDKYYNRLYFVFPNGEFQFYDKHHLFRMAEEDKTFESGKNKIIIEYKGWKICPLICYDLRFPVWSRNVNNEYDILIYVANWPSPRKNAWKTLLKARAAENLSYCIGVNRIGKDINGMTYAGGSAINDFLGETIYENEGDNIVKTIKISKNKLFQFRNKFPAYLDADQFNIMSIK